MDAFDVIWESAKGKLYCTREEFLAKLTEWDVLPIMRNGDTVAIRISKGPEFHFVMTGEVKSVTRDDIRSCIQPLIDEYGYATTRTPKEDIRQQRFNELLGFVKIGEDELDIHYRIDKMRHI